MEKQKKTTPNVQNVQPDVKHMALKYMMISLRSQTDEIRSSDLWFSSW